jgi:hypothetical protein
MEDLIKLTQEVQKRAWDVIAEALFLEAWGSIGAEVNLVGSLKTGLLIKNLDIDFHIYTSPFILTDSFKAISLIAENPRIKRITYKNLLDTQEMCLEWHAWYEDNIGDLWQIDMIHLSPDSPYAGAVERVTDRIAEVLTEEIREAILAIKHAVPAVQKVKGIEVCMAVIRDGIRSYPEFVKWQQDQDNADIIDWIP